MTKKRKVTVRKDAPKPRAPKQDKPTPASKNASPTPSTKQSAKDSALMVLGILTLTALIALIVWFSLEYVV